MNSLTNHRQSRGVALVVTLVILVLLLGMAVGLMQTSGIERGTSKGVAEKAKADLAAQTGVNTAIARLANDLSLYPDSATSWEKVYQSGSTTNLQYQGTALYYREKTPEQTAPSASSPNATPSPLHMLPLISGAQANQIWPLTGGGTVDDKKRSSLPALDNTNSFDLNRARFSGDTQGAVGAPVGSSSRPEFRGQWINLTDSGGKVTGRYAYWMEDESFKVNANYARNVLRGSNTLGVNASEIPLQGLLKVLNNVDPDGVAASAVNYRNSFPGSVFYEYRALNQVSGQPTLADNAKFEATVFSGSSNLSRSGVKRVNLNSVVSTSTDPAEIRKQLDEIINTISYQLPNFAQRFYRTGSDKNSLDVPDTSTSPHRSIYLNKIAANIRDYIDTDSQPTVVNNDGDPASNPPKSFTIRSGTPPAGASWTTPPTHALRAMPASGAVTQGLNEVIAIGKERVPFIQEYALRVRQITLSPRTGAAADYKITIDHYVEFWNTSNRDILVSDLGSNPFLLIANQPGWDAGSLDNIPAGASRDLKLYLKDAKNAANPNNGPALQSFPAGSVTVITTDPQPLSALTPDLTRVFYIPIAPDNGGTTGLRTYSGKTNKKSGSELRLNLLTRTTASSDYDTEIALANDAGILESAWGSAAITSALSVNADLKTPPEDRFDQTKWHFRGGTLKGNIGAAAPYATTGDPRTNAEQIRFDLNGGTAGNDKTRYFDSGLDSNNIPGNSTIGAPNSNYANPGSWFDYSSNTQAAANAPASIANSALQSVAQLGDIFDAVRTKGDATGTDSDNIPQNLTLSRSGGRTLKIGQPERYDSNNNLGGLWDGNSNSASREWTAWRLVDIFSPTSVLQLDGRININGTNRDNGTALKAALYGYVFQATPDSDPNLSGKTFDSDPTDPNDKITELLKQIQARIANDATAYSSAFANTVGPFVERGELSELPMFNTGTDLAAGVDTSKTFDRGREELFRRSLELITTRGNIFTVYAVGQSLAQPGTGAPIITSTSQFKVTFRIDPVWSGGTPSDPWDPSVPNATTNRFKKPDKYAIKILYVGD